VLRSNDEMQVESLVNKILQDGSKILDFKMVVDWGEPSGLVVGILHVPGYFKATDAFGDYLQCAPQGAGIQEEDIPDGDEEEVDEFDEGEDEEGPEEPSRT